jgi:predicted hydrocarbon binding protein
MNLDTLLNQPVPTDYFAPGAYVQGDLELGTLSNRRGNRLLAIPEHLVRGIYRSLEQEVGKATPLVLQSCGRHWGQHLFARLSEELAEYYGKPLAELTMQELVYCLTRCWQVHGWGQLHLDWSYSQRGLILVQNQNSPWVQPQSGSGQPSAYVEVGLLEVLFRQLTGREVQCVQIACISQGQGSNQFLIGLPEQLQPVMDWVQSGMDAATILQRLRN